MNAAVRFEGVSFTYPDREAPTLSEVDLSIDRGAFALVIGPTGAGKSTLLRAMNGLVPHFTGGSYAGAVTVEGRNTLDGSPRDLADVVAYVPQDPDAAFVLDRVEDEIAYSLENLGVEASAMRRRVEEVLDLLALDALRDRSIRSLSGGERQRVAIAAAMSARPSVLLLDEPTSQLDPQGSEDVLAALARLVHDLGLTVVLAEHRLERVAGFADVVIVCEPGGHITAGDPRQMVSTHETGPPVARLGRLLGWDPLPLTVREARRHAVDVKLELAPSVPTIAGRTSLVAKGLDLSYGNVAALRGVDVDLRAGEVTALMGRNGAGKTTLLRCLGGLSKPGSGNVEMEGRRPRPGIDIALCPQAPETVLFKETVRDEILETLKARRIAEDPSVWVERVGLGNKNEFHPRDLSSGQRSLLAVAAIAATGAPVILLDEPTRGLDPESKTLLGLWFEDHCARGGSILFASHDVELVAAVADRVMIMAAGEVIADGTPTETLGDSSVFAPQTARVFGPEWLTPEQVAVALAP